MDVSPLAVTLVAVIPEGLIFTVGELALKFVPVIVTWIVVPRTPLDGEIEVIVGVEEPTVNCTELLSPPFGVDTKTKYLPCTAAELMLNVAVSDVSLWTATFVALTPPV